MHYGPPVPPVNKPFYKHGCFIAFAVVAVLGLLFMGGCAIFVSKAVDEVDKASKAPHVIRYEVTGNSKGVQISYGSLSSTSSATTLPFKKSETVKGWTGATVSVINGPDGGTTVCKIYVDDKLIETNKASGAVSTAICTATTLN
jgi:hypothetical protein